MSSNVVGWIWALAKGLWEARQFRASRREELSVELECIIRMGLRQPALLCEVVNQGPVPVYVRAVELVLRQADRTGGPEQERCIFQESPPGKTEEPLEPGNWREYVLFPGPPFLERALALPPESVWVSVRSGKGEVCRAEGKVVQRNLQLLRVSGD